MQVYLVGGAVRDRMLGLPERECDWVVVGARPDDLIALGYRRVGSDFPVFLHPETGEEYALARTERKTAPGYAGFETSAGPEVTLEQDLLRRDLTINAMAMDDGGRLTDPHGGKKDLEARILRHVSPAFCEDPLRVLRVARFAARFSGLGFTVADETLELMKEIVAAGETRALVPERVWQETVRALGEAYPQVFFQVLRDCGALADVFPEIDALFGVPQPARWHPEIDAGVHTLMVVTAAAALSQDTDVRFAALVHDLGKATTPKDEWPRHAGHEARSARLAEKMCRRLGVPNKYRELAVHVAHHHLLCHRANELRPTTIASLLERLDAYRRPERFEKFLLACEADAKGRLGLENDPYPQADYLRKARSAAAGVSSEALRESGLSGKALGEAIRNEQVAAIAIVRDEFSAQTNT